MPSPLTPLPHHCGRGELVDAVISRSERSLRITTPTAPFIPAVALTRSEDTRKIYFVDMTLEQLIIAAARIAGSLPVLRWAFAGAIIAILVDFSDLFMMNLIQLGGVGDYQAFDKWLDQVYMLAFLWVAVRQWDGPGRTVAIALFIFRAVGFFTFEITGNRWVLFGFPNVFEFWFVAIAAQRHWWPDYEFTTRRIAVWLVVCTALKMAQEWVLHGGKLLDRYRAVDVVVDIWNAVTSIF